MRIFIAHVDEHLVLLAATGFALAWEVLEFRELI